MTGAYRPSPSRSRRAIRDCSTAADPPSRRCASGVVATASGGLCAHRSRLSRWACSLADPGWSARTFNDVGQDLGSGHSPPGGRSHSRSRDQRHDRDRHRRRRTAVPHRRPGQNLASRSTVTAYAIQFSPLRALFQVVRSLRALRGLVLLQEIPAAPFYGQEEH